MSYILPNHYFQVSFSGIFVGVDLITAFACYLFYRFDKREYRAFGILAWFNVLSGIWGFCRFILIRLVPELAGEERLFNVIFVTAMHTALTFYFGYMMDFDDDNKTRALFAVLWAGGAFGLGYFIVDAANIHLPFLMSTGAILARIWSIGLFVYAIQLRYFKKGLRYDPDQTRVLNGIILYSIFYFAVSSISRLEPTGIFRQMFPGNFPSTLISTMFFMLLIQERYLNLLASLSPDEIKKRFQLDSSSS